MARKKLKNEDRLDKVIEYVDGCKGHHDKLMAKIDERADSYHALVDAQKESWYSALYPPYVMHIVETTLASMVEDRLVGRIKPRLTLEGHIDPASKQRSIEGAKAHDTLLNWQSKHASFTDVQRPFLLQNAIAGITVAKTYWIEEQERRRRMVVIDEPLTDDFGEPLMDPMGQPMTSPQLSEETGYITTYDGPHTEVIDIHDFFWEESALTLPKSRYVIHRIRISRDELERGFRDGGPYGPDNGGWTWKQVEQRLGSIKETKDEYPQRWGNKDVDHNKNLLQIWECWDQFTDEVTTIVERDALLAYKDQFPFFHERPPFTVCTTQTDLFKFVGISQVEKVAALQQMLWSLSNQRMDNLRLINNAIVLFNPALEDVDALKYAPGAMWPVESPDLVNMWTPNPIPAEISLGTEALIKGDMQNLASTFPFSSGAESQTVDQKTATGASIVTSLAQRSIDMAKQPVMRAWEAILNDWVLLNQQFILEAVAVAVPGEDDEDKVEIIVPEMLVGDYEFELEAMPSALMKQEKQAQGQALLQLMLQAAPIILPLAQAGQTRMINFDKVIEFYLEAMDIEDPDQFFMSEAPQQAQLPAGGQSGQPANGNGAGAGGQTLGITGEGSIDPAVSPGAQVSNSPITNRQRAMALGRGGGRSV